MGAVLLTDEFPAAGISVFAELWYRESMAGAIYEHDPDLIFSGSDAERAQALIACALYCLCYHRDGVQYHIFLRIIRIISGIHINFSIFQLIDLNLVRSNIVT